MLQRNQAMTIGKRSEITIPIVVRFLISIAAAATGTFLVSWMSYVEFGSASGKAAFLWLVLAAPLIVGTKAEWPISASYTFTFLAHFVVVLSVVMYWCRERRSS